jgi:beta-lactamase regulating signal transducer with metallopeptidase domain
VMTAVLDHLWQSTLFAGAAALVTLLFRDQAARVRFWLWFAASVKFLLPFAALAALGGWLLPHPAAAPAMLEGFAPAAEPFVVPAANTHALAAIATHPVMAAAPAAVNRSGLLFAVWGLGTLAILFHWLSRWRKLRAALAQASDIVIGGVAARTAPTALEPGLVGIFKPVIVLPQGIEERLSPVEMSAVLAHEVCHRAHRDNLLAAIHMLVEALFWFHPLVWWLGARLNHEREQACDEAVVASGQASDIYAESILKVCKLYVHSPLPCVSGVSGADLKERLERIVMEQVALPLGRLRKLLLAGLAAGSLVVPLSAGILVVARAVDAAPQAQPTITPERIAELRAEQAQPRTQVAFDPKNFDRFVGEYRLTPTAIFWITRDGSHYLSRLTGQTAVEIFPESQTKFFSNEVRAQISFDTDASGKVTGLVLHQNGREQYAPGINIEAAKAAEAALLARIRANKPSLGTEAAIRHQIDAGEKGVFDYAAMTPDLAAIARSQEAFISQMFAQLGAFKSLTFKNVNSGGGDVYDVVFERGHLIWSMAPLTADGKIRGMGERMAQP